MVNNFNLRVNNNLYFINTTCMYKRERERQIRTKTLLATYLTLFLFTSSIRLKNMSRTREESLKEEVDYLEEKNEKLKARCGRLQDVVNCLQRENRLLKGEQYEENDSRLKDSRRDAVIDNYRTEEHDINLPSYDKTEK